MNEEELKHLRKKELINRLTFFIKRRAWIMFTIPLISKKNHKELEKMLSAIPHLDLRIQEIENKLLLDE